MEVLGTALLALLWLGELAKATSVRDGGEMFSEILRMEQFRDSKVLTDFTFEFKLDGDSAKLVDAQHYNLFPRGLGQMVGAYGVEQLQLTLTQGRWDYRKWGYSSRSVPSGAQILVTFNNTIDVDHKWNGLINSLAGLLCASLNFMTVSVTTEPFLTFLPPDAKAQTGRVRYSRLPRENVCTENLTPWSKMLPCQAKSGFGSLLNAYRIFDTNYHSVGISLVTGCSNPTCSSRFIQLNQTLTVVHDAVRRSGSADFSVTTLFDRLVTRGCPLAKESLLYVTVPPTHGFVGFTAPTENTIQGPETPAGNRPLTATYSIKKGNPIASICNTTASAFVPHRYLTGYGQERGGIKVALHNFGESSLDIIYMENLPWILKVYAHTFKVGTLGCGSKSAALQQFKFRPAVDRERPSLLEAVITLPPNCTTTLSFEFDKVFLRYTEHPPDSNRGFDIGPAVITVQNASSEPRIFYTENILVDMPTPDFSMPYNVITFTCTVLAYFFGAVFNVLTREFQAVEISESAEKVKAKKTA
ncbi:GPI transamidase component PIG-T [Cladochytrium replicatum]|nr:GPI transamidase component PIG-T [Cladochytrium replicatum]